MGTMKSISFGPSGQFGQKPKIHPVLENKEDVSEKISEEVVEETIKETTEEIVKDNTETTSIEDTKEETIPDTSTTLDVENEESKDIVSEKDVSEYFMCPNCDADFTSKKKLNGHMLKYSRKKKELSEM